MLKAELGGETVFRTKDLKGNHSHGAQNKFFEEKESITNCLCCSSKLDESTMNFLGTEPADRSKYLNWGIINHETWLTGRNIKD